MFYLSINLGTTNSNNTSNATASRRLLSDSTMEALILVLSAPLSSSHDAGEVVVATIIKSPVLAAKQNAFKKYAPLLVLVIIPIAIIVGALIFLYPVPPCFYY